MIPIIDFERRANEGPLMTSDEFDVALAKKVRELVKRYGIKFNKSEIIPDDDTADRVFSAGIDLLAEMGVYHLEMNRVIKWSKEEIEQIVAEYKAAANELSFGKGEDRHTIIPRKGNERRRPVVWGTAAGAIAKDEFIPFIQLMASEKTAQGLGIAGGIASIDGITPIAGSPSEIFCSLWEVQAQKEALRRAGRPGMSLGLIPTASTTAGTAAVLGEGLREAETSLVGIHIIPDQKIDWVRLNTAYLLEQRGVCPWASAMSMVGGLCGGPEGAAIGLTANILAQLSYGHGKWASIYACDMTGRNSGRNALKAYSASTRAANRNLGVALGTTFTDGTGARTFEDHLYRMAAVNIAATGSGAAFSWCAGNTPLEVRISAAVMDAVLGKEREEINEILNALLAEIETINSAGEPLIPQAHVTMPFGAKYEIQTLQPKPDYLAGCKNAVVGMKDLGIPVSDDLVLL